MTIEELDKELSKLYDVYVKKDKAASKEIVRRLSAKLGADSSIVEMLLLLQALRWSYLT